jgi:ferredoxin-thioredoxin reductase catalytic subunit
METGTSHSPNRGKSIEELIARARRMAQRYAEISPYRLNPRQSTWEGIVTSLGRQAYNLGWPYCP